MNMLLKIRDILNPKDPALAPVRVLAITGELCALSTMNHDVLDKWYTKEYVINNYIVAQRKPFVPNHGENFYFVTATGSIMIGYFSTENNTHVKLLKIGNIFEKKQEAQEMSDVFIRIFQDNVTK